MIKEVKWTNHVSLGNLKLDFTKSDGSPYNTIVLAGENGTGKTTVLSTLSTFLNLGSIEAFEYMTYQVSGTDYKITPSPQSEKSAINPNSGTNYQTLPTYIRNAIDHPDSGNTFTDEELNISIELLVELCR